MADKNKFGLPPISHLIPPGQTGSPRGPVTIDMTEAETQFHARMFFTDEERQMLSWMLESYEQNASVQWMKKPTEAFQEQKLLNALWVKFGFDEPFRIEEEEKPDEENDGTLGDALLADYKGD